MPHNVEANLIALVPTATVTQATTALAAAETLMGQKIPANSGYATTVLTQIELYLAAHILALNIGDRELTGMSSGTFSKQFKMSEYGSAWLDMMHKFDVDRHMHEKRRSVCAL